jgi:hypothetical protein
MRGGAAEMRDRVQRRDRSRGQPQEGQHSGAHLRRDPGPTATARRAASQARGIEAERPRRASRLGPREPDRRSRARVSTSLVQTLCT